MRKGRTKARGVVWGGGRGWGGERVQSPHLHTRGVRTAIVDNGSLLHLLESFEKGNAPLILHSLLSQPLISPTFPKEPLNPGGSTATPNHQRTGVLVYGSPYW